MIRSGCSRTWRCSTCSPTAASSWASERASRRSSTSSSGIRPEEASARSQEILRMLLRGWETGIISSEGSTFYDFLELKLPFEPVQHPYPPLWTAGNVETAGRGGHNFIFPTRSPQRCARATTSCGRRAGAARAPEPARHRAEDRPVLRGWWSPGPTRRRGTSRVAVDCYMGPCRSHGRASAPAGRRCPSWTTRSPGT